MQVLNGVIGVYRYVTGSPTDAKGQTNESDAEDITQETKSKIKECEAQITDLKLRQSDIKTKISEVSNRAAKSIYNAGLDEINIELQKVEQKRQTLVKSLELPPWSWWDYVPVVRGAYGNCSDRLNFIKKHILKDLKEKQGGISLDYLKKNKSFTDKITQNEFKRVIQEIKDQKNIQCTDDTNCLIYLSPAEVKQLALEKQNEENKIKELAKTLYAWANDTYTYPILILSQICEEEIVSCDENKEILLKALEWLKMHNKIVLDKNDDRYEKYGIKFVLSETKCKSGQFPRARLIDRLFRPQPDNVPKLNFFDTTILAMLRKQFDLDIDIKRKDKEHKRCKRMFRIAMENKDKARARHLLKRSKLYAKSRDSYENIKTSILEKIESLQDQKVLQKVFDVQKRASECMKANELKIDEVQELMDDLRDAQEKSEEVAKALGQPVSEDDDGPISEAQLDAELAQIIAEENKEEKRVVEQKVAKRVVEQKVAKRVVEQKVAKRVVKQKVAIASNMFAPLPGVPGSNVVLPG